MTDANARGDYRKPVFGCRARPRYLAAAVALAALVGPGCGSDGDDSYSAYCERYCERMGYCGLDDGSSNCLTECEQTVQTVFASPEGCWQAAEEIASTPCEVLQDMVACAEYCAALCQKAESCGNSDTAACGVGCMDQANICNARSVEPRTCAQLEREYRCHTMIGESLLSPGNDSAGCFYGGSSGEGSLCRTTSDCAGDLACNQETNVCGPCQSDEDCDTADAPFCDPETLRCLDCVASKCDGVCDPMYGCVDCILSTQCEGNEVCHDNTCRQACTSDEQCPSGRCYLDELCAEPVGTPCNSPGISNDCPGGRCLDINTSAQTTVTALVNKLVRLGYLKRKPDPEDSRVILVRLSEKGRALIPEVREISRKLLDTAYREMSQKDRVRLVALLRRVHDNF